MKIVSTQMTGGIAEIAISATAVCAVKIVDIHIGFSIARIFSTVIFPLNVSDVSILSIQKNPMNVSMGSTSRTVTILLFAMIAAAVVTVFFVLISEINNTASAINNSQEKNTQHRKNSSNTIHK